MARAVSRKGEPLRLRQRRTLSGQARVVVERGTHRFTVAQGRRGPCRAKFTRSRGLEGVQEGVRSDHANAWPVVNGCTDETPRIGWLWRVLPRTSSQTPSCLRLASVGGRPGSN